VLFAGLFSLTQSKKETKPMNQSLGAVRFVKSENLPPSPGYSQAVEIRRGRIIYVAGQVALDRSGKVLGEGDMRAQAQLKAALEASGAKFEDVIKLNYYFSDITQLSVVREVRDQFINTANPPASTAVEVKRLFREPFLIEVEAIAVVPE
jgi:enamine deaminase RidA (YjgF/YER057c/UK114 family)